jgi:hypothetical protein
MAQGTLLPVPIHIAQDANGARVANAKLYVYAAGTGNYASIFTDQTLAVQLNNPLSADGSGNFVEIWITPGSSVDIDMTTSAGTGNSLPGYPRLNVPATPLSSGNQDSTWTAGENITVNDPVYLSDGSGGKTAGRAYKADAANDYSSTLPEVAIAVATVTTGNTFTVRKAGQLTGQVGLTTGATYYVASGGGVTTVAPSLARRLGQALSTTVLEMSADPPTGGGGYDYAQLQVFGALLMSLVLWSMA